MEWLGRLGWIGDIPSFLYESTWLVAFITSVIVVYLYRANKPGVFVQLYLLSMAVKLLAALAFCILMVLDDPAGSVVNVVYFLLIYLLFTALEIAVLYRKISS